MNRKMLLVGFIGLSLVLMLLAACADQGPSPAPTTSAVEEPPEWDVVLISDSGGRSAGRIYAEFVEHDLGVKVTLHDFSLDTLSARSVVNYFRDPDGLNYNLRLRSGNLAEALSKAEVVVFYANPESEDIGDWSCESAEHAYVEDCSPETFDAYREDLKAIYEQVFRLRGDSPLIVRAFDASNPFYSTWRQHGVFDECLECWETYNAAIHQAAAEFEVPVAAVFDAFNGPDHDEDPRDKGYISSDGIHPSAEGAKVIAELLSDLGYEPTQP